MISDEQREGDDADDAELQLRPGERTCAWHELQLLTHDRNACRY